MNGDIITDVSNYIGGAFGYLIICLMTIGCMWAVFRVGLSTSKLLKHIGKTAMDK
jgi:TRAP-type mannitol/chloroaromatic compound transport system permease small subunit